MGALHTMGQTQLKTEYTEPGAEHSLFIHRTDDGEPTHIPCGTWTNYSAARNAQEYLVVFGQCGACKDQAYCSRKGAGRMDCKKYRP